jgi:hypothetical protein
MVEVLVVTEEVEEVLVVMAGVGKVEVVEI